ncbi:PspC domain-containing protein [Flindersiella endophytica]
MTESPSTPPPPPPDQGEQSGPSGQSGHSGQHDQRSHHGQSGSTLSEFRKLRRAKAGRVVGGVCAGLGRDLRIDPVILRVVVAVMIFFGGAGLLIYGAAWLLIPEEGDDARSILERQLGRRPNGQPDNAVVVGGVVVLFLLIASVPWWGFSWHPAALLLLAGAGLYFLLRRNAGSQPGDGFGATPPGPPSGSGDGVQSWFGEQYPATGPAGAGAPATRPVQDRVNGPADSPAGAGGQRPAGPAGAPGAPVPSVSPAMGATSGVTAPLGPAGPGGSGQPGGPSGPGSPQGSGRPNGPSGPASPAGPGSPGGLAMPEPSPTGSWRDFRPLPRDFWNQPDPLGLESDSPGEAHTPVQWTAPLPPVPRRRSRLFWVTSAFALIVLGAMALIDQAANVSFPAAGYVAAPLAVVGLGLIAGAWWGRSPGLVVSGVLLSLALVPTTVGEYVSEAGAGSVLYQPRSVSEIKPSYDYGAGQFTLDLRNVTFADEDTVKTAIDCGACDVQVLLPANVDTTLSADVALGDMQLFPQYVSEPDALKRPEMPERPDPRDQVVDESGRPIEPDLDGVDDQLRTTDLGVDGAGGGKLNLNVDLGVGNLEVSRG